MANTATFPYFGIPREASWREVMADRQPVEIDPHLNTKLRIKPDDKIASAGSCFAQRISESLQSTGYNYLVTEEGSPFLSAEDKKKLGYGLYSARYGNVFTALQLLQLFRRAFGRYEPSEPVWQLASGRYVDPFRPAVHPDGFESEEECLADREAHLAAVRRMFEEVDVFAFTLGLTETWYSKVDGAAFPACPGSPLGGTFDPSRHAFHNASAGDVTEHLNTFIAEFQAVNPKAQIILTVSPVPLLATFEQRHVLQATVYSKSVLRVASEEIVRRHPHVHYFASYEIVLASGDTKNYFLDDHRTVSNTAVAHVIECFHRQFTGGAQAAVPTEKKKEVNAVPAGNKPMCDEDLVMAALADQVLTGTK